jgi:hypothetical protein
MQINSEWQDISLIVSGVTNTHSNYRLTHLLSSTSGIYRTSAKALITLGKGRLGELLEIEMPAMLLTYVIAYGSDKEFRDLSEVSVNRLLRWDNDDVRKVTSIKCAKIFSKSYLISLLEKYVKPAQYFYNVVHWLDFGISLPKPRVVTACNKILAKEWGLSH